MSTEFDWAALDRQPLPVGQHPKTWPSWGTPRADGREIVLESLRQYYIYAGDLLGGMHHPRDKVVQVVGAAKQQLAWCKAEPVVLPPILLEYSHPRMPPRLLPPEAGIGAVTLPRVASIALLRSHREARDSSCCFSSLIVIWFQESFGDAPPAIQAQIAAIDWDALAFDWMP